MDERDEVRRNHYLAGVAWRLWSEFWANSDQVTPPFTFLRTGANNEVFIATGATFAEVESFVVQQKDNPEYEIRRTGNWMLNPYEWIGHWNCFYVYPRRRNVTKGRVELYLARDTDDV